MVNANRSCTTPGCKGNFAPVAFNCHRLGGAITVRYSCDGCNLKGATFKAHSKCETVLAGSNTISVSLQVAFIIAGSTHATYCKTLGHSLGIDTVSAPTFMCTIRAMYSIVAESIEVYTSIYFHTLILPYFHTHLYILTYTCLQVWRSCKGFHVDVISPAQLRDLPQRER